MFAWPLPSSASEPSVARPTDTVGKQPRLRLLRPFLPLTQLTSSPRWMTRPLRSAEFPRPLRYYGSLRPCASLRYSHPGRAAPWISPLPSRRQVPTTPALDRRSSRWFGACPCRPAPGGLPPSLMQQACFHVTIIVAFSLCLVAHGRPRTGTARSAWWRWRAAPGCAAAPLREIGRDAAPAFPGAQ